LLNRKTKGTDSLKQQNQREQAPLNKHQIHKAKQTSIQWKHRLGDPKTSSETPSNPVDGNWYEEWLCIKSIIKSLILHMYLLFLFGFFIIIDVLFSNEVSFNVSIGFWSLNELFQKIQRRNSEQRIEEKFSWRLKKILVQISAPNLPQKSILFQF
jgi:hypothetical protein